MFTGGGVLLCTEELESIRLRSSEGTARWKASTAAGKRRGGAAVALAGSSSSSNQSRHARHCTMNWSWFPLTGNMVSLLLVLWCSVRNSMTEREEA